MLFAFAVLITVVALLLVCLVPVDAIRGEGWDSDWEDGALFFLITAPTATVIYLSAWWAAGHAYRRMTLVSLGVLWGVPVVEWGAYYSLRPIFFWP